MSEILNLSSKFGHFRCFQFGAYSGLGASKIIFSEADLIQSFTIDIASNTWVYFSLTCIKNIEIIEIKWKYAHFYILSTCNVTILFAIPSLKEVWPGTHPGIAS